MVSMPFTGDRGCGFLTGTSGARPSRLRNEVYVEEDIKVTPLQRHIMKLLVDDEAAPLSELEGTMEVMFEYPSRDEAHERVREALIELIDKGLVQIVYYDPPFLWENRTDVSPAAAGALLADPKSWVSPLERIDSRQVRAASTDLGQRLFF